MCFRLLLVQQSSQRVLSVSCPLPCQQKLLSLKYKDANVNNICVILKPLPMIVRIEQPAHKSDAAMFFPVSCLEKALTWLLEIPLVLKIDSGQPFDPQNWSVVRFLEAVVILASKHLQPCRLFSDCGHQIQVSWKISYLLVLVLLNPMPLGDQVQASTPSDHRLHVYPLPFGLRALAFQGIFLLASLFSCLC